MRNTMRFKSAVMPIIMINVFVFLLQKIIFPESFIEFFVLKSGDLLTKPFTLVTSMFMHGGFLHILINMFVLYQFGRLLESKIGMKRFLLIYFGSGLLAGVIADIAGVCGTSGCLGASGAVMGILGVVMMILPNLTVMIIPIPIPLPFWVVGAFIVFLDFLGALGIGIPGIANEAHLVGIVIGLAYGYYLKKSSKKFRRKMQRKSHLTPEDMEDYIKNGRI